MNHEHAKQAKHILATALPIIRSGRQRYGAAVLVMAPMFTAENSGEGYMQRVAAIDGEILQNRFAVYVDFETKNENPTLVQIGQRHLHITFPAHVPVFAKAALRLAKACGLLYTHSVMRAMADMVGRDIHRLYTARGITKIWDVHGCVPEEFALADNYYEAQNAGEAEALFIEQSDIIITVNHAMRRHLEEKYRTVLPNAITLPIFSPAKADLMALLQRKPDFAKPICVYAGGLQAWQNIPLMQDVVAQAGNAYQYKMFVPKPAEYTALWGARVMPAQCEIATKTPAEVLQEYERCHFGFVLRDAITVNRVACPTKLIEYLQYGIVPVLKTDEIGDFKAFGMRYITYERFMQGQICEADYRAMASENMLVLQKLLQAHDEGCAALLQRIAELTKR